MCNKNCCNHTYHAIIFLFILSLLLLLNSPNLSLFLHKETNSSSSSHIKGGGGDSSDDGGGFHPCTTTATTTKLVMAFLYGALFTLVLVILSKDSGLSSPIRTDDQQHARGAYFIAGPSRMVVTAPTEDQGGAEGGGVGYALLRTLPTFAYSVRRPPKIGKGSAVCVICQFKFRDEELVRWLPECDHLFHLSCIDEWLSSHKTCPSCRSDLGILTNHGSITYGTISPPYEIYDYFSEYYNAF